MWTVVTTDFHCSPSQAALTDRRTTLDKPSEISRRLHSGTLYINGEVSKAPDWPKNQVCIQERRVGSEDFRTRCLYISVEQISRGWRFNARTRSACHIVQDDWEAVHIV